MIKKVLKVIGILLFVILVTAIVLPFAFKSKIESKVKEEINSNVNAKINWKNYGLGLFKSFPNFNLSLENLTVVGVNEFANDTLANIKTLNVTIDLMSVISGSNYSIKKISLDEPRLLFKVLKNGKANWDISKPTPPSATKPTEQPSAFKLTLQKVSISKGNLIYDAQDLGMKIELNNFDHTLTGDMTADLTTLDTKTLVEFLTFTYGGVKYLNKVNAEITAALEADIKNFKFTFKDNEFRINQLYLGMDGFVAMPKSDINLYLKFNAKKTEFKNFISLVPAIYSKDFDKIETKGKLALDGYVKGVYNDKRIPGFALNIDISNAMFKYPSLPKAVTNINIKTKIENKTSNLDNTIVDVSLFHVEMGGNPFDMKMLVKTPISDANIKGEIKGKMNLGDVKDYYPLEKDQELNGLIAADIKIDGKLSSIEKKKYEEFKALGSLEITNMKYKSKDLTQGTIINEIKLLFSPQYVEIASCNMKIGKSDISAKGRIDNLLAYYFKKETLKGTFDCTSNLLDLNEFIQPSNSEAASNKQKLDTVSSLSVIDIPANIDFTANAKFGKILYDKMIITNVVGGLIIKDKKISLDNLKLNMLDGQLTATGYYETKNIKKPKIDFNLDIKDFDISKTVTTFSTVKKLAPIASSSTGKFSAKMKLNTELDSKMSPVYNSMSGEGNLNTSKLTISGFEPLNKLGDALKMDKFKRIVLDKINLSFSFIGGKVVVKPFDFKYDNIKGKIGGSNSFDQSIDYVMNLEIPKSEFGGQANGVLNNLTSKANSKGANVKVGDVVKVDALIGGTITKPTVKLGLKGSMNEAIDDIKNKAKEEVDKKKQELENKAKVEADKAKADAEAKAKQESEKLKKDAETKANAEKDKAKKEAEDKLKKEKDKLKNKIKF